MLICVFLEQVVLGKSFFTKLLILRYSLLDIEQYVIDPEREYTKLAENIDGTIIKIGPNSKTYINIFDIRKESIEEEKGYLATKISKLIGFFHLIFGELNEEEKGILEEKLIKCYEEKGINFNDESLYKNKENNKTSRFTHNVLTASFSGINIYVINHPIFNNNLYFKTI